MSGAADVLRKAMKGFGTDEDALIKILAPMGPLEVESVKDAFKQNHKRDLMKDVHSETSGYFREGLEAILRGPLEQDCYILREGLKGIGTKEEFLDEVLLGRSNADINAIKAHYQHMYKRSLESDMKSDLSAKTERMFDMILAARRTEDSAPINPQQIENNVNEIYKATEGKRSCFSSICAHASVLTNFDQQARWERTNCKSAPSSHQPTPPSSALWPKLTKLATNAPSRSAFAKSSPATCRMLFSTWSARQSTQPSMTLIYWKLPWPVQVPRTLL
jgi:annexin A7/11